MSSDTSEGRKPGSLYEKIKYEYNKGDKKPCARLLFLAKLIQPPSDGKQVRLGKEEIKPELRTDYISELKEQLLKLKDTTNTMIIFLRSLYVLVGVENSTEDLMTLVKLVYEKKSKVIEDVKVIYYNEECPVELFPAWYVYERDNLTDSSDQYSNMFSSEIGWTLYNRYFCAIGKKLKEIIRNEEEFNNGTTNIKQIEEKNSLFFPSLKEIDVFFSEEYMTIEEFVKLYLDEINLVLDDDMVYPYYWPIGTL